MKGLWIGLGVTTALVTLFVSRDGDAATRARSRAETVLNDPAGRISAGGGHSCQVNEDGTVRCWGANNHGQLGNGTTTTERTVVPVLVSGVSAAVAVLAIGNSTCALLASGSIQCWGLNGGLLGDGTTVDQSPSPVIVVGITTAVAIASGANHWCAVLANGTVRCWGSNNVGRLGDGTTIDRLTPVTVVTSPGNPLTNVVAIAAGFHHTCALRTVGTVHCWGENLFGQLGIGTTGANQLNPVVLGGLSNVIAITAATYHTCALRANGTARCWGLNGGAGVLGDGTTVDRRSPVTVSGLSNAVAIDTGDSHTCALLATGTGRCWGFNGSGQLGNGTTTDQLTPGPVATSLGSLSNAVAITSGGGHTCALLADGSASCWGRNVEGQLGISNTAPANTAPTPVLGGGGTITARDVAAGRSHTCAVRANGTVACWGSNGSGQLGDGTTTTRLSPVAVPGLVNIVAIAAGEAHTCALPANGTVLCWGDNDLGQLGDGTTVDRLRPVALPGAVNAVGIAAGGALGSSHTCVLLGNGRVRCWGANGSGQLGIGNTLPSSVPVTVSGLTNAVAIAVGEFHTCALVATGVPFCWGFNGSGRLGDGTLSTRTLPTLVSLDNTVAIAGGNAHTCALRGDGTAWCWGANALGQLGIGSTVPRSVPTFVNLSNVIAIAGGFGHTCALLPAAGITTGAAGAFCWGDNGAGQLGSISTASSLVPVAVSTCKVFSVATICSTMGRMANVTTGRRHSCLLSSFGGVFCSGENAAGQLGIGSTTNQPNPVGALSFALNIDPVVTLKYNNYVSTVTILARCEAGQRLHVNVSLTQAPVSGHGVGAGKCTGVLQRYPVPVPAQGEPFAEGPADVTAEAHIRERGSIVDRPEWTRKVQIVSAPDDDI